MSDRKSPSGTISLVTGIIALAQTVIAPGSAGNAATATGVASVLVSPGGTALALMNGAKMRSSDIVSASPRGTVPLGTSQIGISYARVLSAGSAVASVILEFSFINPSTASATLVANTWNLGIRMFRNRA